MSYNADMTIAEVLDDYISSGETTATALAAALGVSQPQMSRYTSGENTPSANKAAPIAKLLGIPEKDIIEAIHRQKLAGSPWQQIKTLRAELQEADRRVARLTRELRARGWKP